MFTCSHTDWLLSLATHLAWPWAWGIGRKPVTCGHRRCTRNGHEKWAHKNWAREMGRERVGGALVPLALAANLSVEAKGAT